MDAHEWLSRVRKLDRLIDFKNAEQQKWREMAMRVTPNNDGMPRGKGGVSDPVGNAVEKIVALSEEVGRLVDEFADRKKEIIETLERLPVNEYEALYRHYIEYHTWERVAELMNKSTMQVWRYKKSGLKNLNMLLNVTLKSDI